MPHTLEDRGLMPHTLEDRGLTPHTLEDRGLMPHTLEDRGHSRRQGADAPRSPLGTVHRRRWPVADPAENNETQCLQSFRFRSDFFFERGKMGS
jgi:hypothetical protein